MHMCQLYMFVGRLVLFNFWQNTLLCSWHTPIMGPAQLSYFQLAPRANFLGAKRPDREADYFPQHLPKCQGWNIWLITYTSSLCDNVVVCNYQDCEQLVDINQMKQFDNTFYDNVPFPNIEILAVVTEMWHPDERKERKSILIVHQCITFEIILFVRYERILKEDFASFKNSSYHHINKLNLKLKIITWIKISPLNFIWRRHPQISSWTAET
jgi:hypothetical protein